MKDPRQNTASRQPLVIFQLGSVVLCKEEGSPDVGCSCLFCHHTQESPMVGMGALLLPPAPQSMLRIFPPLHVNKEVGMLLISKNVNNDIKITPLIKVFDLIQIYK